MGSSIDACHMCGKDAGGNRCKACRRTVCGSCAKGTCANCGKTICCGELCATCGWSGGCGGSQAG